VGGQLRVTLRKADVPMIKSSRKCSVPAVPPSENGTSIRWSYSLFKQYLVTELSLKYRTTSLVSVLGVRAGWITSAYHSV
jgi:hypothetical protein